VGDDSPAGRDQLVAAAWDVLGRTGFEGFKVASVIRASGASTRTFYRHFASKDHLFVELLSDEARRGAARIDRLVAGAADPPDAVRTWIAATMSAATTPELQPRARLFTSLSERIQGHSDVFESVRARLRRSLEDAIEAGRRSGDFSPGDPAADAARIQRLCGATMADILSDRVVDEPDVVVLGIQEFALRALRAAG
jgi:AcrR family transcriptional regulator